MMLLLVPLYVCTVIYVLTFGVSMLYQERKIRKVLLPKQIRAAAMVGLTIVAASCGSNGPTQPAQPDLPKRQDVWVTSLTLDADSKVQYIGKTKDYLVTNVTTVKDLSGPRKISVGDEIEGIRIGAIRCSFFWKDASYGGSQYMWRGRWGCMAGRNKGEIENAVGPNGEKYFEYLYISPVSLNE